MSGGDDNRPGTPDAPPSEGAPESRALASEVFDDSAEEVDLESSSSALEAPPAYRPEGSIREAPNPALSDARIGTTLVGRYRIEKLVGKGGMGRVYRATQFPLNRPVAVKILSPEFQRKDPQFVRRFFLEAASAAKLTHPNTITVFDYGESEAGELFIAMEYLQGRPLSRVITTEGRFGPERILHVGMQICRALREAHAKGIIHRDLKPGNILLLEEGDDGDFVKVLDFGLVKLFDPDGAILEDDAPLEEDPDGELTKAGMFLGSPKYMSPEQIQGLALDPRTDIYALGVLMFQMASGRPPFTGASSVDVIYRHVNAPIPPLASLGVEAAPELEAIIRTCLAKRRDDRFRSMNELLARMKDVHRGLTGYSGAETGFSIDLAGVGEGGRSRPMTHPRLPAQSEAALREPALGEDTGASSGPGSSPFARERGSRVGAVAAWIVGGALAAALGTLAFFVAQPSGPLRALGPEPAAPAARSRVVLSLVSEPPGAQVFHDGVSLGPTPARAVFAPDPSGERVERFVFRAPGYVERTLEAPVGTSDARLEVELVPLEEDGTEAPLAPEAEAPDPGEGSAPAYKENPY